MNFDVATYEAVMKELEQYLVRLKTSISIDIPEALDKAKSLPFIGFIVGQIELLEYFANLMIDVCKWLIDKLIEILKGALAPYFMYVRSRDWNDVRDSVTSVQSTIDPNNLPAIRLWKGAAQMSYMRTATTQSAASGKIGDIADKIKTTLLVSAGAGLAFYIGIALIVKQFLSALALDIALLAAGFTAAGGVMDFLKTTGITTAQVTAAVAAIGVIVTNQATALSDLEGLASDNGTFPNGESGKPSWPASLASTFSDASVEGDGESKWRLN
ncbi:hypothetical protein [Nocardia mangyaensis]|uniref:hypothetical protein n=1 Tax=Nocardia mangyaensis TaxID=2213200 RepID=UPI002676DFAA|nr:hypothetical protein [Nocardia mangyaensis]MDO3645682.1 hypothetical protein [Nocardia mangyaensis]